QSEIRLNLSIFDFASSIPYLPARPLLRPLFWLIKRFLPFYVNDTSDPSLKRIDPHVISPRSPSSRFGRLILASGQIFAREPFELNKPSLSSGLAEYQSVAKEMPQPIIEQMKGYAEKLWSFSKSIPLYVEPSLAASPWEALLTIAVFGKESIKTGRKLRFFRAAELLPNLEAEETSWNSGHIAALDHPTWALLYEKCWETFSDNFERSPSLAINRCRVLHIIANLLQTTSGLRLEIKDRSLHQTGIAQHTSSTRSERLIEPAKLPVDRTWLLVLQAEPSTTATRLASDREQMALLRSCATEAFTAGAPAVLTLPPLPESIAEKVVRQLARGLRRSSLPSVDDLSKLVEELQKTITQSLSTGNESPPQPLDSNTELALDICLFARYRSIETLFKEK